MKKISFWTAIIGLMAMLAGFVSCNKDESSISVSEIAGSWELVGGRSSQTYTGNDDGESWNYEFSKNNGPELSWLKRIGDILVINSDGTGKSPTYYGNFEYTLKGNKLICRFKNYDDDYIFVVKEVTADKLVLYFQEKDSDGEFYEEYIFSRVK